MKHTIRELREARGESRSDLAEALGGLITLGAVSADVKKGKTGKVTAGVVIRSVPT